jgi:hypothetical protein
MNDDRTYDHKIPERVGTKKYLAFFAKNVNFRSFARELFCFATVFAICENDRFPINLFLNNDWTPELC